MPTLPRGLKRFGWLWPAVAAVRILWWIGQGLDSLVDAGLKRLFPPRYELTGGCGRSGNCCEFIGLEAPGWSRDLPRLLRVFLRIGEILYPFRYDHSEGDLHLYTCFNFDRERRLCGNYRFRPRICRDYPVLGYFAKPGFLKGCGFGVRLRGKRNSFAEALDLERKRAQAAESKPPNPDAGGPDAERTPTKLDHAAPER